MATSFTEMNGRWTFYAKVRLRSGFEHKKPGRLWNSIEACEKDVKLFVWYRSIRTPNDPIIPHSRGQWFETIEN